MDFYRIRMTEPKKKEDTPKLYPDWVVGRSKDLMVRGKSFHAIWDEVLGLWSTDEYDVQRLVDEDLHRYSDAEYEKTGIRYPVLNLKSFDTQVWVRFRKYMQNISDSYHMLDERLIFANTDVQKTDYASRRLPYTLERGTCDAWNELLGTLYADEERAKIEWIIGAIVSGDSKKIQKFLVFYGPPGSGKSTVLNIIQKLFEGYATTFDAKALGSSSQAFATEVFKSNPLVAIQHDGDLSRIDDNARLNSIISHEEMTMNEKYKSSYTSKISAILLMGTNTPVRISDAKAGIIRRLIDVHPTGKHIPENRYHALMNQVNFELGAIAHLCLDRYLSMGKNYYSSYRPVEMMLQTDVFYNFVEAHFDIFKAQNGTSLKQAYKLYKEWCVETGIDRLLPQYKFREELRNYFDDFLERTVMGGETVRSYYSGFKDLTPPDPHKPAAPTEMHLTEQSSKFDELYPMQPAQYAKDSGYPGQTWSKVKTTLSDVDTTKLHFVKIPENHIVIDFDLVDEDGNKSFDLNQETASKWPPTYSEVSKSGAGIHLHYIYSGDVHELSSVFDTGIEVKTLLGNAALRRMLSKCNDLDIAIIGSGLPKKDKPMIDTKTMSSEKGLRELIERNLRKEIHPGTKPSIDFIRKILDEAYDTGMSYNVQDMRSRILTFAAMSSNQASTCIKEVQKMQFIGQSEASESSNADDKPIVFFDVEVYSNLFVVCWKYDGPDHQVVRMINPSPQDIEPLFSMKLTGFYNRNYDNHIMYARYLGYSNEALYALSQKLIGTADSGKFGEAYNISYTDIYDFSSLKQGLKKFEIQMGLKHMEMDIPWDQPVKPEDVERVVDYCVNDVVATEAVFHARKQDFVARQILAELSGLTVNHTTQQHTGKIIFGENKNPQSEFVYTKLDEMFPGYVYGPVKIGPDAKEVWCSTYRGEITGEGGYVYAEPGIYEDVAVLDVASMHPTSIIELNAFGPYTSKFKDLLDARLAIKAKDFDAAAKMLDGKLAPFIKKPDGEYDIDAAKELSYALKIVINIVYGLTSAKFGNLFKDNRNTDNIVAKRGALFMIDLKHAVREQGFTVAHIKTDSIKIPHANERIIEFVMEFGRKYGYTFEHEDTYSKFCLVNDAVYIAQTMVNNDGDPPVPEWTAVGAQFQHPYVFKTLFSGEDLTFDDFCETKSVTQGAMYLDFDMEEPPHHNGIEGMTHVGRTGSFVPVVYPGAALWRVKEDKFYAVTGTKGYLWVERETALSRGDDLQIDMSYFEKLANEAKEAISLYGDFDRFVSNQRMDIF